MNGAPTRPRPGDESRTEPVPHLLTWQINDTLASAGYAAVCLRCGRPVRDVADWLTTACVSRPKAEPAA